MKNSQGRSFKDKTPIFGMLQRKGDVICRVVENTSQYEITPNILKFVEFSSVLYTDEWQGYNDIAEIYTRFSVDHSKSNLLMEIFTPIQ